MGRRVIFGHRDGFTLDSVLAIQDLTTLNPVFNALLFAFFLKRAKAPLNLRLVGWLLRDGRKNRTWGTTLSGLFLVISLLKKWSDAKSRKARNNGTEDVYDWTKEVVVVTGASSGIGARVSQMLGERGIKVVGIDVQRPLYQIPPRMTFYTCDITSRDKVKEVGDQIRGEVGTPTILLNNAGIGRGGTILSVSEKDVRAVMDVNAISHFWTVQEFLPAIIQRNHGHVITIASMASYVVPAGIAAYGMSKAAAMAFHETLTMELLYSYKARKVRTSMINPLWTATPLIGVSDPNDKTQRRGPTSMHVDTVAEAIVDVIIGGESKHVMLPRAVTIGSLARGLPDWLHWRAMKGASRSSAKFDDA